MKGTPAIAVATVSNGIARGPSAAGVGARPRQLALDRVGLVVGEALLALLQHGDRALRVAGHAQRARVLEQRVGAGADRGRALAELDGPLRERERLLGLPGLVEVEGLELERRRVAAGGG